MSNIRQQIETLLGSQPEIKTNLSINSQAQAWFTIASKKTLYGQVRSATNNYYEKREALETAIAQSEKSRLFLEEVKHRITIKKAEINLGKKKLAQTKDPDLIAIQQAENSIKELELESLNIDLEKAELRQLSEVDQALVRDALMELSVAKTFLDQCSGGNESPLSCLSYEQIQQQTYEDLLLNMAGYASQYLLSQKLGINPEAIRVFLEIPPETRDRFLDIVTQTIDDNRYLAKITEFIHPTSVTQESIDTSCFQQKSLTPKA